jgi:hypothetical protein
MGAINEYVQIDPNLSCKLFESGKVAAIGDTSPGDGSHINLVVVGTPDKFIGSSNYTNPEQPPIHIPVDSRNLGDDSLAGQAAALAKLKLQKCWDKVGPSF